MRVLKRRSRVLRSFTLIEVSIVLGILALFLGIVYPRLPVPKSEKVKSDARVIVSVLSGVLRESVEGGEDLKVILSKRTGEIKVMRCTSDHRDDENWRRLEKLRLELGFTLPFDVAAIGPSVCEWKEKIRKKTLSSITSIFVDGEEIFGEEVEVIFQRARIPLLEVELEGKMWIILNPYTLRVFLDTKPAHEL